MPYRIDEPVRRPCPHGWYYGAGDAAKEILTGYRASCPRCAREDAAEVRAMRREYRASRTPEQKRGDRDTTVVIVVLLVAVAAICIVYLH
jgi:hypothetical protein